MLLGAEAQNQLREEPGPLYLKIATLLRREVASGRLAPGEQLPSLDKLASDLGVALVTLRQAVACLEDEGLLRRRQGKGTFVDEDPLLARQLILRSDWSSLIAHLEGKKPELLQMADSIATPSVHPEEGHLASVYRYMRRLHRWEETPYALINIYLDRQVYDLAPETFDQEMVIATLHTLPQVTIGKLHQTFGFTTADTETAALLRCPVNGPIGEVRRVITDKQGRILYLGETSYRGDLVKLQIDIEG
jgi:GntR family transcriptional regulator